jgi:Tfp pilus assembly protein PilO
MNTLLNKLSPASLYGVMAALVILTCLAAYLYGFKEPLKAYKLLKMDTTLLEAKVENGSGMTLELERVQSEIAGLTKRLQGEAPPMSHSKMVAHVINRLDIISSKHVVQLLGVRPAVPGSTKYFEELPFSIEVSGNYFSLFDWLQEVERELGPMVVKKINVEPTGGIKEQIMRLNLVSYRLKKGKE